jgi:hypothetical protein
MCLKRSSLKILVFSSVVLLLFFSAAAATAQQATNNSTGGAMPLTFILESALDSHAQDIQENIFEYKFEAANNDPAKQSILVQKRSNELKNATMGKKAFIQALLRHNGSISDEQMAGMADELGTSVQKLDVWSKKLEEHAANLAMLNGHRTYTDEILPLMGDIEEAKGMAEKLKDKKKNVPPGQDK